MATFDFNNYVLIQGTLTVNPANFTGLLNSPRPLTPLASPFTLLINKTLNSQLLQQIVIGEEGYYLYTRVYNGKTKAWSGWTPPPPPAN